MQSGKILLLIVYFARHTTFPEKVILYSLFTFEIGYGNLSAVLLPPSAVKLSSHDANVLSRGMNEDEQCLRTKKIAC